MNTCDTCKWWGRETDEPGLRECKQASDRVEDGTGFGVANCLPSEGGRLATGPKFGCIHHVFSVAGLELELGRWCKLLAEFKSDGPVATSIRWQASIDIVMLEIELNRMRAGDSPT